MLLDLAGPFIDVNAPLLDGHNPLFYLCGNHGQGYDMDKFRILLEAGADPDLRDLHGHTCVHACLIKAEKVTPTEWNSILFLTRNCSEFFSSDDRSTFDSAYRTVQGRLSHYMGSYRGDLWDAILTRCGYDIRRLRQGYPRKRIYTPIYTRADFERMWGEREHLCPYYDDPPVWYAPFIQQFELSGQASEKAEAAKRGIVDDGEYYVECSEI
jgi:hypothetical protein